MTLLRRAPREVYRLYGEDEFFATSTPGEDHATAEHRRKGSRRLQRFAGVAILLAVVGVVGGMVAITSVSRVAGARRRGIGRLSAAAHAGGRTSRMMPAGKSFATSGPGGRSRRASSRGVSRPRVKNASGPTRSVQTADVGTAVNVADSWAGTPVSAPRPVQAEFGFER